MANCPASNRNDGWRVTTKLNKRSVQCRTLITSSDRMAAKVFFSSSIEFFSTVGLVADEERFQSNVLTRMFSERDRLPPNGGDDQCHRNIGLDGEIVRCQKCKRESRWGGGGRRRARRL